MTPWTVAHQAPLSMGSLRQENWSGLQCPPPGDHPNPGIDPGLLHCRQILLPSEPPGKPRQKAGQNNRTLVVRERRPKTGEVKRDKVQSPSCILCPKRSHRKALSERIT